MTRSGLRGRGVYSAKSTFTTVINLHLKIFNGTEELAPTCAQIVLTCLYLVGIGRPASLWPVNMLARSVTKWSKVCGNMLARLRSYISQTKRYRQNCFLETNSGLQNLDCFRTLLLPEVCKIPKQLQAECYLFLDHKQLTADLTAVPNQTYAASSLVCIPVRE